MILPPLVGRFDPVTYFLSALISLSVTGEHLCQQSCCKDLVGR